MIYKKAANFSYPILSDMTNCYSNSIFELKDVNLKENEVEYIFEIDYELESEFIKNLLDEKKAKLFVIISSKDSKFYDLKKTNTIKIGKKNISLNKKTSIQLFVQSLEQINFCDNNELISIYEELKNEINVDPYSAIAISNIINFDGSKKKPFDLFEKKLDENIKSDIKIELGKETIIIKYKSKDIQFHGMPNSNTLNNPYVYIGLQRALYQFIINNKKEEDMFEVDIDDIDECDDLLDSKLLDILKTKGIEDIHFDNLDEVIYKITDRALEKNAFLIKEMLKNEN